MKHTPTPWTRVFAEPVGYENSSIVVEYSINGKSEQDVNNESNDAFIVRACNSHAALVAQLTNACNRLKPSADYFPGNKKYEWYDAMVAVVKEAEGK